MSHSPRTSGGPAATPGKARSAGSRETRYIRAKVDQLLQVMGTAPLRPEELDDATLIDLDPIGIVAESFRRILEHHRSTNEQLRFAREELQAIFDSAGLGIMLIGPDLTIEACNARLRRQFGLGDALPVGRRCYELVCDRPGAGQLCPFLRIFQTGEPCRVADHVIRGRHYEVVGTPLPAPEGGVAGVVLVYADITERLRSEEALRRSEERYRDLFENVSDLIVSIRLDGSLDYVNASWCETLGYTCGETAALSIYDLLHPDCDADCRARITDLLAHGRGGRVEAKLLAKDGRTVVVEGDLGLVFDEEGRPAGIRGILRDVTEKETLEAELRKREKLESVGLLAGGIAHDFNNLLTAILGNVDLALLDSPPGTRAHQRLREAERATISARDLTQQLLTFAKGGSPIKTVASLGELLREHSAFAVRGSNSLCEVEVAPDLWPAEVDTGQIGQVVHNLVLNAVQAMAQGGRVHVRAENLAVAPEGDPVLPAGRYLRIEVRDEGPGIPAADLKRIFEPYFTTKKGGSGLGLAVTHSIVRKHDGVVRAESEPGRGTTFSVLLPATDRRSRPRPEGAPALTPRQGRILVLDDEREVRDVAGEMLAAFGCDADSCSDGEEAVRRYAAAREAGGGYAAVILDLTIPGGMGGREAAGRILAIDPDARLIVSSGYSNDPVLASYAEHGFRGRIAKPYRLADLAAVVRQVVDGGAGPAAR